MSTERLQVIVGAETGQATQNMSSFGSSVAETIKTLAKATAAVYVAKKAFDFIVSSVQEAAEEQKAYNQLAFDVEKVGVSYANVKESLDDYFTALQRVTAYGDDEAAGALDRLVKLSRDFKGSVENLPLVLDIASSGLMEVDQAARAVSFAMAGEIQMLQRMLPELRALDTELLNNMSASERAAYALNILKENFGGAAQAELNTYSGKIKQLTNYWGDFKAALGEQIAAGLVSDVDGVVNSLVSLKDKIAQNADNIQTTVETIVDAGGYFLTFADYVFKGLNVAGIYITAFVSAASDAFKEIPSLIRESDKAITTALVSPFILAKEIITGTIPELTREVTDALIAGDLAAAGEAIKEHLTKPFETVSETIKNEASDVANSAELIADSFTKNFGIANDAAQKLIDTLKGVKVEAPEIDLEALQQSITQGMANISESFKIAPVEIPVSLSLDETLNIPDVITPTIEIDTSVNTSDIDFAINSYKQMERMGLDVADSLINAYEIKSNILLSKLNEEQTAYNELLQARTQAEQGQIAGSAEAYGIRAEQMKALYEQDYLAYLGNENLKTEAARAALEERIANEIEFSNMTIDLMQTATTAAINEQNVWVAVRKKALDTALGFVFDFLKKETAQYIRNLLTKNTAAAAAQVAAVTQAGITGAAITAAMTPAAVVANIASFGGAAVAAQTTHKAYKAMALAGFKKGGEPEDDGLFSGSGSGTSDSNIVRISDGEFIVNADSTAKYRPVIEAINNDTFDKIMRGFANGGAISSSGQGSLTINQGGNESLLRELIREQKRANDIARQSKTQVNIRNEYPDMRSIIDTQDYLKSRMQAAGYDG